ncbi:hypothetical protein ACOMHN_006952 [Nucella lapillus]
MMMATRSIKNRRLTHTEVSQRFQQRQELLQQACNQYKHSNMFRRITPPRRMILESDWPARNKNVLYCPIQKTGSTTWSHVIHDALKQMTPQQRHKGKKKQKHWKESAMMNTVRFLFVREPYSRLLSGYVDKLFSPNSLFWKTIGTYVIQNFRSDPSDVSVRCGHDVTFEEYVRYVIHSQKTLIHRNMHFVPSHDHCDLCNVNYSYIGHLETLQDDMIFLLKTFHLPENRSKANFDSWTIIDNSGWVLQRMKTNIRKCMTMHEACLRLWKKWHIRGIISKNEPLPVTAEEAENISRTDFIYRTFKALDRSGSREKRKLQKTEAMRQAFASLSEDLKLQVQEMLTLDFDMFGFDPKPESVFPSAPVEHDGDYKYFDLSEMTTTAAKRKRNPRLTVTEVSQRFQHRQALLQQACLGYKHSDIFHRITPQRMTLQSDWPARNSNLLYCPIQKTGSTTWFEIVREARKERESVQPPPKHREENKQNNDTVNFLFVREPYSRLLSGYVDKIFSPNTMFWESTGTYIVRKYRSDPSDISFRCGHDVTFEEYIRYVVDSQKTLQHRNAHFIPSHDHCNLCNVNYSYIGHLETLRDDMRFLVKTFHLPGKHTKMNFDKVTIIDNSGWVISIMKTKIRKCMTMHKACLSL